MNSPNNGNYNPMSDDDKKKMAQTEAIQELTVIKAFTTLFSTKVLNAKFDHAVKAEEFKSESNILRQINGPGVLWGLGAGISSFIFLRRGPIMVVRALHRRGIGSGASGQRGSSTSSSSSSGYTFNRETVNNPFDRAGNSNNFAPNASEPTFKRRGGIFGFFGFLIDTTLSLFVGANVSWVMTDKEQIRNILTEVPLVDGRSVISDELCMDAITAHNKLPKQFWTKDRDPNNPNTTTLNLIHTFVRNCGKRMSYEKDLRMQQGLPPNAPVSIPVPGVPKDYPSTLSDEVIQQREIDDFGADVIFNENMLEATADSSAETWDSFGEFQDEKKK